MTRLPRSTDDLRGLRAARWTRESTRGQMDNLGPEAQARQQDDAIARHGLVDAGIGWVIAHSGYRKDASGLAALASAEQWREMLARAGHDYDVLVVGYVSRWIRDTEVQFTARRMFHQAGASILFADDGILTSDEDAWERWAREAVESEAYSRRLAKRIREGYDAKFRVRSDQAGPAPLGFARTGPGHTLALDPSSIGVPVAIFERYASGTVSYAEVGEEFGMEAGAVREILRNPVYNGWARRHRRSRDEQLREAAWRDAPPVDDALWARVAQLRRDRTRSNARRSAGPPPMLSGLLWCACGERISSNGERRGRPVVIHLERGCATWGDVRTRYADGWRDAIAAQVTGIRVDRERAALIAALVGAPDVPAAPPDELSLARRRRDLAMAFAQGRIDEEAFRRQVAGLAERPAPRVVERADARDVLARIRALPGLWRRSTDALRRDLLHSVYERIEVAGDRLSSVRVRQPWMALALPTVVDVVSREGLEPSTK